MRFLTVALLLIVSTPVCAATFTEDQQTRFLKQCNARAGSNKERKAQFAHYCQCSLDTYSAHLPANAEGNITQSLTATTDDPKLQEVVQKGLAKCAGEE